MESRWRWNESERAIATYEIDADCTDEAVGEDVIREAEQQTRLSDTRVTNDQELEQVITTKAFTTRPRGAGDVRGMYTTRTTHARLLDCALTNTTTAVRVHPRSSRFKGYTIASGGCSMQQRTSPSLRLYHRRVMYPLHTQEHKHKHTNTTMPRAR